MWGYAPITRQSGKRKLVVRRLAASRRLQNVAYHWALAALQRDPRSRAKYSSLRQRGHGHARALRSVADRLLAMLCAMLRTQTLYDPDRHAKPAPARSEEHTSELQSLMRNSYAVFCLKKTTTHTSN